MRISTLVSLGMMAAGGVAAMQTVSSAQRRRAGDKRVSIVVDYDDVQAVSARAGLPLCELLRQLKASGATHCTVPELTINRLLREGRLLPCAPRKSLNTRAPAGRWNYLTGGDVELMAWLVAEMQTRLPQLHAQWLAEENEVMAFAGDLTAVGGIGLGFDAEAAREIHDSGLAVIPRPVSYDWHERALIERTLAQAAEVGDGVVAFEGDLILGHEMHLDATVAALEAHRLTFAYFAQSRHQRGDWFIAKRRAPHVVIAHQFTPAQMIPEDYHSISHHWAMLAQERGVRMMFVNFFRVIHATEPLECLHYLEHIRAAVEGQGFTLAAPVAREANNAPAPNRALTGLVAAGAWAMVAKRVLGLNEAAAVALAVGSAGAVTLAGRLDRARDSLEQNYRPTYSSKLLALGAAALSPLAAWLAAGESAGQAILADTVMSASSAAALAALTSSDEYRLRVEEYKGFDLDLWLPIVGAIAARRGPARRWDRAAGWVVAAAAGWLATRKFMPDPLGRLDCAPAMSHIHHLSAAMRAAGDVALALGPRPARKWAGLAPLGVALGVAARRRGRARLGMVAAVISAVGHAAALTGFRKPERDPRITAQAAARSWLVGALIGWIVDKGV
ncbi:MAG: hypothetical protein HY259_12705 [Chloroflexi bacterium]|nr:hypothetical protein [Chloroflexota bacterium]